MRVLDGDRRFYALQALAVGLLAAFGCPLWLALAGLGLGAAWAIYNNTKNTKKVKE